MADGVSKDPLSLSPNEGYNPLEEDFNLRPEYSHYEGQGHDADCSESSEDDDGSSQFNSVEEPLNAALYSITPPVNQRGMKREKKKHQSHTQKLSQKQYSELRMAKKVKQKKESPVSVIKERYADDPLFCKLSSVDSDDNFERDFGDADKEKKSLDNRESKKKSFKKSIAHERMVKRNSGDLSSIDTNTADVPLPLNPVKVDTSGRFTSLSMSARSPSLSFRISPHNSLSSSFSAGSTGRPESRRQSVLNPDIPKERVDFHKIFSTLINMGSQSKKEKDNKKEKEKMMNTYKRQMSSEQELWAERYKDMFWLELQMEQNGFVTVKEAEDFMRTQKEKITDVLEEILNFKFEYSADCDTSNGCVNGNGGANDTSDGLDIQRTSSCESEKQFYSISLTNETIDRQREALIQVNTILSKLDSCEKLFQSSKAFAKEFPMYKDKEFVQQLKTLYLWQNITKDLCHKMKILGRILGVQNMPDIDWPMIDLESPRHSEDHVYTDSYYTLGHSIPEIQEPSEEDDDPNEAELTCSGENSPETEVAKHSPYSAKRVKFSIDSARSSRDTSRDNSPVSETYDTSTPLKVPKKSTPSSPGNLSHASSEASLDDFNKTSVYRKYVDKTLKRMGMNKLLMRFKDLLERTLQRAREALERPKNVSQNSQSGGVTSPDIERPVLSSSPALELNLSDIGSSVPTFHRSSSLTDFGTWGKQFVQMGLPSFRPSYLFLLHVFLDVIHEALRLRLEQRPVTDPSYLSIRPLLKECKEVLRGSVIVKQYYQTMVDAVTSENEWRNHEEKYAHDLEQFDADMRSMLEIYFTYLQSWLLTLQNLPEASRSLKNVLEFEWKFTKQICPHVVGGEAEAGKRFSTLASSLLNSISDFLENGIDDFTTSLYNWTMQDEDGEEDPGDLQEEEEEEGREDLDSDCDSDGDGQRTRKNAHRAHELRHSFQQTSRNCKKLFNEARERASKALGFAKTLRKDLEIAADFNIAVTTIELLATLKTTNHVMVFASIDPGYLMFIPQSIRDNRYMILQLLNVTCGREDATLHSETGQKDEGYLLMVRCGGGIDHNPECPLWFGESVKVEPTAETAIALSHIEVEGLLLVVINSSHLTTQRKEFERVMGKTVELVNEQTSCHQAIAESLTELKASALDLQERVVKAIKQVDEKFYFDELMMLDDSERSHLLNLYRETMLKGYNLGFEYLREVTRLVTGEPRQQLSRRLVEFAKDWMTFVTEKCEKGRGMRPKWASQGFDFLIVAFEPKNVGFLTDDEYQELKRCINNCISHVIGSADARATPVSPTHGMPRSSSVDSIRQSYIRYPSWPNDGMPGKYSRSTSTASNKSTQSESPTTPGVGGPDSRMKRYSIDAHHAHSEVDVHDGEDGGLILDIHLRRRSRGSSDMGSILSQHIRPSEKRENAIMELERKREQMLREHRVIGHMTSHQTSPDYRISARRVNFRWQRGTKIGEGQFGKVYSAVNVDTGELMAMKEMKFQANDHQALKEIADEIILFEGIQHQNLVKYYGVEVHRDEMLVFMEYCDRGTLEEAAKMGLPEHIIRIYTREILLAINHLHENNIVHRDIKGANIFLTSSGTLKLGDFGCSAKLKNHATMPGEFNKIVGTMAYMAPEVFTKNTREGHGRAADIWSLGCVVVEISAGKRPWHELENNAQIMWKVGMGGKPLIPDHLSEEGKEFLTHCFELDPSLRWTASQLLDHSFVKVQVDEENQENEQ